MAPRSELVDHLGKVELFADLSSSDVQAIARVSHERRVSAGEAVVEQGEMGTSAFVVIEGQAVVSRGGQTVATLGPGAPFGELSLLDHGPRTAYVTAETDLTLLEIPVDKFQQVLTEVPRLSLMLLATLAGRIRELDRKVYG